MQGALRLLAAGTALAVALGAPARAELKNEPGYPWRAGTSAAPGGTASAVVVRIVGGFHPVERWLWYDADGTARLRGVLELERGLFRARTDFRRVAQVVEETGLCTLPAVATRPAGMDMFTYHVAVRCDDEWRVLTSGGSLDADGLAQTARAVRELRRLGETLAWKPSEENVAPPDRGGLFHTADLRTAP